MAAKTTAALARAHAAALQRGDHQAAEHFAESAAQFAMYYAMGVPMLTSAPRKPARKRKPRARPHTGPSKPAIPAHAHERQRRENLALAAFVGLSAVVCVLSLALAVYQKREPALTHTSPSVVNLTDKRHN